MRGGIALLLIAAMPMAAAGQNSQRRSQGQAQVAVDGPVASLLAPEIPAVEMEPLTLAEFESLAFQNNPTLAAAAARIDSARGKQVQAGLYPNPVIGYHGVEIGLRGTSGQQGAFVSQQLVTGGKLGLDQAIAGKDTDEAHVEFHAQEQRVLSDVRVRFYDACVAQQRLEFAEELSRLGEDLVAATQKLLDGRQGTENDLLQAEIQADEAYILLDNARNHQIETWRRLVAAVGVPEMSMQPLRGKLDADLPSYDWDGCYAIVLSSNPTLQAARIRAERARLVIQRAQKEPIPDLDVSLSHRHHNFTTDDVTNVQVGIAIPVFNQNQGNIRSAQADWVAACNDVRRIELELQDRLAVAYRRFANAWHQADRYSNRMVPRAEKSLRLVSEGYEMGQVEYLTLLTAQQTYLQVNLSYLDSLRELLEAWSLIEGQLLSESLSHSG